MAYGQRGSINVDCPPEYSGNYFSIPAIFRRQNLFRHAKGMQHVCRKVMDQRFYHDSDG